MSEDKTTSFQNDDTAGSERTIRLDVLPDAGQKAEEKESLRKNETVRTGFMTRIFFSRLADVEKVIDDAASSTRNLQGKVEVESVPPEKFPDIGETYESREQFAEGGQATLQVAKDKFLKRLVALKTLKPEALAQPGARGSFIREARLTSQLDHPSIVPVYAIAGDNSDGLHITMKLIRGKTLKQRLRQVISNYERYGIRGFDEQKSLRFRLDLFLRVCDAISYAHSKKVIHCDLKPENIMIGEYHETYVMDWGISRELSGTAAQKEKSKTIAGTPRYLAPEVIRGEAPDPRSDIFALGLILYEVVTLNHAAIGSSTNEILVNMRDGFMNPVVHRFGARIHSDLRAIIEKALQNSRERRYQTVAAMSEDIRRYLAGCEVSANPLHFFGKTFRWICGHAPFVVTVSLAALLCCVSFLAWGAWNRYAQSEEERVRDRILSDAYSSAGFNAMKIDRITLSASKSLEAVSDSVIFLLRHAKSDPAWKPFTGTGKKDSVTPVPSDYAFAPVYGQKLSTAGFYAKLAPGLSRSEVAPLLGKLEPMNDIFRRAMLSSNSTGTYTGESAAAAERLLRTSGLPLRWIYVGFKNGLHINYPCVSAFSDDFDPRKRPWYQECETRRSAFWGVPYVDALTGGLFIPYAAPVYDEQGTFFGAAALDLSLKFISDDINASGNTGDAVLDKLLLNRNGVILVGDEYSRIYENTESVKPLRLKRLEPEYLWRYIRSRGTGYLFRHENGRQVLYIYIALNSFPGYYLEKLDFTMLRNQALKQK